MFTKKDRIAHRPTRRLVACLLALLMLASGCNLPTSGAEDAAPSVTVRQPTSGVNANLGEGVKVVAQATDDKGIVRVELWVDGQLSSKLDAPNSTGLKSFNAAFSWVPSEPGNHVLQVKAIDTSDQSASAPDLAVIVQTAAPPTAPTPTAPVVTATELAPTPAATAATVEATGTPAEEPAVTADNAVNVRSGPGLNYTVLGQLTAGQTVRVTGRNDDTSWWQIVYVDADDGKGWVFADLVTANDAAASVPVVEAPAAPTAQPTVPVPPTAPAPSPTPSVFRADRTTVTNEEPCTTLRWDVDGVIEVHLDPGNEGVGGHDSRQVCPAVTTTFTLRVTRTSGEQSYDLTITVSGSTACTGDPVVDAALGATSNSVNVNEAFSLVWRVTNIRGIWIVVDDDEEIPEAGTGDLSGGLASHEFSYGEAGTHHYQLKLQKCDGSFIFRDDVTVTVH